MNDKIHDSSALSPSKFPVYHCVKEWNAFRTGVNVIAEIQIIFLAPATEP
jgi:hypothetical protein